MDECFITTGTPEDQCQLACKVKNGEWEGVGALLFGGNIYSNGFKFLRFADAGAQCLASTNIGSLKQYYSNRTTQNRGILLRPGSPCNDYKGYCDIFQKCRSVDSNGPLSRLKNLLFNSETLQSVRDWVSVSIIKAILNFHNVRIGGAFLFFIFYTTRVQQSFVDVYKQSTNENENTV